MFWLIKRKFLSVTAIDRGRNQLWRVPQSIRIEDEKLSDKFSSSEGGCHRWCSITSRWSGVILRFALFISLSVAIMMPPEVRAEEDQSVESRWVPIESDWDPEVEAPEFQEGRGPKVMVDEAHGNYHTIDGRYASFAKILRRDGYQVVSGNQRVSADVLDEADIFVTVNAMGAGSQLSNESFVWSLPPEPAFKKGEVAALASWVSDGGSLLLISDHAPFPGPMESLAAAFDIVFINGYAVDPATRQGIVTYTSNSGGLGVHPILMGRRPAERVTSVKSFLGQAFRVVRSDVKPVLRVPDHWQVTLPRNENDSGADVPRISARGLLQGAVFKYGRGRVAVFGEAAMFSTQSVRLPDGSVLRIGMNDPEADQNAQFLLNVLHWLSIDELRRPKPTKKNLRRGK